MNWLLKKALGCEPAQSATAQPESGNPEDAVVLVSFPRIPGSACRFSPTPFAGKLEAALRLAGIPFSGKHGDLNNPKQAPRRKFPTLMHGGNVVVDSSCIWAYLADTYPEKMKVFQPDDPLAAVLALALQRMLEEDLYFAWIYCAWQRDDVFDAISPILFSPVPAALRPLLATFVRSSLLRDIHGQGMGRQPFNYVKARMREELQACDLLLEKSGAFLTGDSPVQADCFLFAFMEQGLRSYELPESVDYPVPGMLKELPNCMAFYDRLCAKIFPDGTTSQWTEKYS